MDSTVLIYYAIICGCLGIVAPRFGGAPLRLGFGVVVGIAAALALPTIRSVLGV